MGVLDAPSVPLTAIAPKTALPAGLGWDSTFSITPTLSDAFGPVGVVGDCGYTPEALFGRYSNALTAPATTLYVDRAAATDTADGSSWANAIQSLKRAVDLVNAATGPVLVYVKGGIYERTLSFYYGSVTINAEVAFVAVGGRVVTGTFDLFTSSTPDGTYANCYTLSVANCDRVLDTATPNRFGNHTELTQVASAALCNATPGSWFLTGSTLYIHRADGSAITTTNTRVFRNQTQNFYVNSPKHLYIGGAGRGYGFDFEGATNGAVVVLANPGSTTTVAAAVIVNSTAKYGGGAINTGVNGFGYSSWNGIVAFFNCGADANASDGFNGHNAQGNPKAFGLTVNCSARDNGRGSQQSCQGLTIHEDMKWVDIAGWYERNRGGNIRNINSSKMYCLGTLLRDDLGDLRIGGAMPPTGVRLDDTAEGWFERVKIDQPRGQAAWATGTSTAKIHRRSCLAVAQQDTGPGVFDAY
ncbi:hypothetical protein [uncultured Microbacterium sp.]|uniref:hypothetical protein n=1 Tax=uncultured Microbacterium sp. TaxID=191216 RepID=UPI002600EEE7|nr:hypothetical protein [uncultured Microbacterium sp.]